MTLKVGAANYVCHYSLLIKYMYRAENWLLDDDNKAAWHTKRMVYTIIRASNTFTWLYTYISAGG